MPLSIEVCSAPIAVMTEMTEKTPMVMPIMVRAERSLFAPSEDRAIFNDFAEHDCIANIESAIRDSKSRDRSGSSRFEYSHSNSSYFISYRSAVTGSSREADQAGAKPENNPGQDRDEHAHEDEPESKIGSETTETPCRFRSTSSRQRLSPMKPPSRQSAVDSIRNCSRIVRRRAPSALRVPISLSALSRSRR